MKRLTLDKIVRKFNLKVEAGRDKLTTTLIKANGVNRAGLELTGFFRPNDPHAHRIVLMSSKEFSYISQFNHDEKVTKYEALMASGIPGIIITKKYKDRVLIEVARKLDFPVLETNAILTSEFSQRLGDYIDEFLAPQTEVHASLVNIYGKGILLLGRSGIGKSEITLDLIKKNHLFVGDDRIVVTNKNNRLFGKSSPILKNLVEVRGIGIIDISLTNGYQIIMEETNIDLVIELFNFKTGEVDNTDRLGNEYQTYKILSLEVPLIRIPVSSGRNLANIIESAVAQLKINEAHLKPDPITLMNSRLKAMTD
ncbi:Hpr(Ser) kinase/phosphatase [Entomoplasma freundtii]|uniref:HPr kinase/phosphorylase n=1 Tax=Entomoplasma freundtii TaxID=74700 RepID=A0A2K8NS70_9MOLU|nr:HPr(Ser) kinase/phosphatase [Entomoplasma freundtii]ATZ16659.1 HPr kinase/phosphorylase [Entomoplasma freundtii]TDY58174.1 Hpr(Ser) kinase/phosphatase [Entomoplasma freundtii]